MTTTKNSSLGVNSGSLVCTNVFLIICYFLIGCSPGEEKPSLEGKYTMADISGNWTATQVWFQSMEMDNSGSLDVIEKGGSLKMTVQNDGKFTNTITLSGKPKQVVKGKFGFEEEWLAVSYNDAPEESDCFYIEHNDAKTSLILCGEGTYDYEDDGTEVLSSINLILERD